MAKTKKRDVVKEFKGKLVPESVDPLELRMAMSGHPMIKTDKRINFNAAILPEEYDPETHEISGKFFFEVTIAEK